MRPICFIILLPLCLLAACRSQKQIIYQDREVYKERIDTLLRYDRDSIFVAQYQKGDTIFVTQYKERWRTKEHITIQTDTLTQTLIEYKHTQSQEVPPWCWYILALFILEAVVVLIWLYFKLKPPAKK